jgi:hypothetical protein
MTPGPTGPLLGRVPVLRSLAGFDTVTVKSPRSLTRDEWQQLCATTQGEVCEDARKQKGKYRGTKITVQRPTEASLLFLAGLGLGRNLTRVDLAIDFMVATSDLAEELTWHLRDSVAIGGRLAPFVKNRRTFYSRDYEKFRHGFMLTLYGDRPSKWTGEPCAHVEARLRGRAALEDAGLSTIEELLAFDHRAYWAKVLDVRQLPSRGEMAALRARVEVKRRRAAVRRGLKVACRSTTLIEQEAEADMDRLLNLTRIMKSCRLGRGVELGPRDLFERLSKATIWKGVMKPSLFGRVEVEAVLPPAGNAWFDRKV